MQNGLRTLVCALLLGAGGATLASTYTVVEGSRASYRVREQLARLNFPNDAVGVTEGVRGRIVLTDDGRILEGSEIVVDVSRLQSDESRRDGYLQRSTLESTAYPEVTFVPTEIRGVTFPLPESGEATLSISGRLTVRDVTRAVVWQGTATFAEGTVALDAATRFTFADFELEKPSVMSVLSVDDTMTLEVTLLLDKGE